MAQRLLACVVLAVSLALAARAATAVPALADGDPASDVLLFQPAFFPYAPPSNDAKAELLGAVAAARKAGYTIRVAVIQSRRDLGADPELYAKPQLYARFLDAELRSAGYLGALAVVMPQGFGVAPGGRLSRDRKRFIPRPIEPLERAVKPLEAPGTNDPDTLTAAGVTAVKAMSAAAGHPIKGPIAKVEPTGSGSSGSGMSFTSIGLAGGLVVAALAAIALIGIGVRRNRPTEVDGDG
ncbi:MAG TPA: hypothetical protein VN615_15835 [Gaiellales bacterium]|nr:hypothetical protein [Gaiellales bacterium]